MVEKKTFSCTAYNLGILNC